MDIREIGTIVAPSLLERVEGLLLNRPREQDGVGLVSEFMRCSRHKEKTNRVNFIFKVSVSVTFNVQDILKILTSLDYKIFGSFWFFNKIFKIYIKLY